MKTIYLMRHSIPKKINLENKDIPLSQEGIEKVKRISQKEIFNNINGVYSSTYKRAYQTAEVFQKEVLTDDRLKERLIGSESQIENSFWEKQYQDENFKNKNGESFYEVRERMTNAINVILDRMKEEEKVLIVSHAAAICSYLLGFCKIDVVDALDKIRRISFQGKIIMEDKIKRPSCFILKYLDREVVEISYLDLEENF